MVVDNHINVVIDSGLNNNIHETFIVFFIGEIVACAPVSIHTHRSTNQLNILITDKLVHMFGSPERSAHIACDTPEKAHALHSHFGSIGNTLASTINLSLAVGVFTSLQLTVLAHRANATKRKGNKAHSENAQAQHLCAKIDCHTSSFYQFFADKFRLMDPFFHVISST